MVRMARMARMSGFAPTLLFLGAGKSWLGGAISAIIGMRLRVCEPTTSSLHGLLASILSRKSFNASLISESDTSYIVHRTSYRVQTMIRRPRIDYICE